MTDKVGKLRLNLNYNINLFGSDDSREKVAATLRGSYHGNHVMTSVFKIDDRELNCNLWSISLNTTQNTRMFFSKHTDYCIISINLKTATFESVFEMINHVVTLCPGIEFLLLSYNDNTKNKDNICKILQYAIDHKLNFEKVNLAAVPDVLKKIMSNLHEKRKEQLRHRATKLLKCI